MKVIVNEKEREITEGMTYGDLAAVCQAEETYPICMAEHNKVLRSLWNTIEDEGTIRFVTTGDAVGNECYRRSVVLLCMKAFYDVLGRETLKGIQVHFSVSKGFYVVPHGNFTLNEDILAQVDARMRAMAAENLPIRKHPMSTSQAVRIFREQGMEDKVRLFDYRRASQINLYEIDGFYDYLYGYMMPSCGPLTVFSLHLYREGFVLQLPKAAAPDVVPPFEPQEKVTDALVASTLWSRALGASTVADLNAKIVDGSIHDLVLVQEATQNQKLSDIAAEIKQRGTVKFIMIAGPSSSGKTTFSHRLSIQLRAHGLVPHPIGVDNYFKNRVETPRDENGDYNYEDLTAIDVALFNQNMSDLLAGKRVELPEYNFVTGEKEFKGDYLQLGENDILVIEGIHCLNKELYPDLPQENMYKIYISALTQLNVDEHNRVATTDGRLIRRMVRDARTRGNSAANTIARWPSVRRGEEKNIFPFQETADVVFNSAQIYELSVLKPYAEPLLFSVPKGSPEYVEAKRLLKFLDYFLTLPAEGIPHDSILREFVGGSVFHV